MKAKREAVAAGRIRVDRGAQALQGGNVRFPSRAIHHNNKRHCQLSRTPNSGRRSTR